MSGKATRWHLTEKLIHMDSLILEPVAERLLISKDKEPIVQLLMKTKFSWEYIGSIDILQTLND